MRDVPNWLVIGVVGGIALYAVRKIQDFGKGAADVGEKASAALFDFLHPSLRPENYNKATAVPAQMVNGSYVCPIGYRYKKMDASRPETSKRAYPGEHWCFRED